MEALYMESFRVVLMEIPVADDGTCCGCWCCSNVEDSVAVHYGSHVAIARLSTYWHDCVYPCRCVEV